MVKKSSSKLKWRLYYTVSTLFECIVFPVLLVRIRKEIKLYKKYTEIFQRTVNENEEFFKFLEQYNFRAGWFSRLYSNQTIPEQFMALTEDELYDKVEYTLLPMTKTIEKNVLINIISPYLRRIAIDEYVIILEPLNYLVIKRMLIKLAVTIITYSILLFTLFYFFL